MYSKIKPAKHTLGLHVRYQNLRTYQLTKNNVSICRKGNYRKKNGEWVNVCKISFNLKTENLKITFDSHVQNIIIMSTNK